VDRGSLRAVVAETYGLEDATRAHRDMAAGGYVGKLVVTP
jgi:NADPH:quinone reductase-like Zn-dependent oxidoreductase